MIVKRVTDISEVLKIVPIETRLRAKEHSEVPIKDMLTFVNMQLSSSLFAIWMVLDGEAVAGYACTLINPISRDMMIWRIWYDQHKKEAMKLLESAILQWGKEYKTRTLRVEVVRGIRALQKTWGFKPRSVIMERRI
jgi:hypothetical protein